jgi:uncharacterized protein (TIGR02145 family)
MKKGIFTTMILLATLFCAAQNGLTLKTDTTTAMSRIPLFSCGTSTVADADGNVYSTVQIGDQCWMGENLRVGVTIPSSTPQANNSIIEKYCYGDNPSNCNTYGGLYQWNELMQYSGQQGAQGICPSGWHIPSNGDWNNLALSLNENTAGKMKTTGTIEGGTGLWYAPNTGATNSSGFSALPGGWKNDQGNFTSLGYDAFFFSSSGWWDCCAHFWQLNYDATYIITNWTYKWLSMSVRCLKNPVTLPTVSTTSISGIAVTTAVGGGDVTSDGGEAVTARGVVWSTSQNPTVSNYQGITTNGTGVGVFISNLTGLAPHTTYYVRAYATNSVGTSYGNQIGFATAIPANLPLSGVTINAGTVTCFDATQTITVSNFTVNGGSVTLIAGGNILLQPATIVGNGGYLHASITTSQNYCLQPPGMLQLNNENTTMEIQTPELHDHSVLFTIFPNPTSDRFTLETAKNDSIGKLTVEIYGMRGEKMFTEILNGEYRHEFSLANYPVGLYVVRVTTGELSETRKIVKQ